MSALICNLPSVEVWVRKEYLTDHQSGHGEFVKGVWVSVKSIPGRAFYFETYLPEYAAMYDKLPISAFVADPETPSPDMNLPNLQFWNCMDYGVVSVDKKFIGSKALMSVLLTTITMIQTMLIGPPVRIRLNISLIT